MGISCLIVDDSAVTRAMIRRAITISGIGIDAFFEAANGCEALDILRGQSVSLVLADLHMPTMGGEELIIQMQADEQFKKIPVIVISAEPNAARIIALCKKGARSYLRKPFTPEEVHNIIGPFTETLHAVH